MVSILPETAFAIISIVSLIFLNSVHVLHFSADRLIFHLASDPDVNYVFLQK